MSSKHIFPPALEDDRIKDIIAAGGGVSAEDSDIGYAFREACALLMGQTAAWAINYSVDDVWHRYLDHLGITDTSEPFSIGTVIPTILTEDGLEYITKQDGKAIIQE